MPPHASIQTLLFAGLAGVSWQSQPKNSSRSPARRPVFLGRNLPASPLSGLLWPSSPGWNCPGPGRATWRMNREHNRRIRMSCFCFRRYIVCYIQSIHNTLPLELLRFVWCWCWCWCLCVCLKEPGNSRRGNRDSCSTLPHLAGLAKPTNAQATTGSLVWLCWWVCQMTTSRQGSARLSSET